MNFFRGKKYPFIIGYDANEIENIITELEKLGCDEIKQLDFANCIAVSMSMAQLKAIKTLYGVEKVERDYDYICLANSQSESDYAEYLAGENPDGINRKNIRLAVFDTGVSNVSINGSVNLIDDILTDENGHGTQMAGIISFVVANAENKVASSSIYSVVADNKGFAKTSTIMQALDWAINNKINIVCMCFGDYHKSSFLENMINRASACGIVMVAAVGNDGSFEDEKRIMYPAAFDNVLSVGAKNGDAIANYSNGGEKADCFANGSQITTDVNGNAVNVIGTSSAAAFVAGTILKNWCISPKKTSLDIIADIKTEMSLSAGVDTAETLTLTNEHDILINQEDNKLSTITEPNARSLNEDVSVLCVGDDCDDGCSSNDMSSAINVPFFSWQSACITCPGNEVWYKFTTNIDEAHANGSRGWYGVQTQGSLDTVGYLYDAYGNQIDYDDDSGNDMNFKISKQLEYGETYYVKVKAYGSNTGSFTFKVDYGRDDHGNSMDTATEIIGVYYEDKSINGRLHSYGDVDYYTFVPARNCVMEIYTEGDTNTYGQLYCASGGLLDSDADSNGNGNFKITAHLEGMKRYYIAVSHNSSTGYGDYTLRFKFVRDFYKLPNDYYSETKKPIIAWFNDEYTPYPTHADNLVSTKYYMYTNKATALLWRDEYIEMPTFRDALLAALNALPSETENALYSMGISYYSFSDIIGEMIAEVLLAFIEPYIQRTFFNATYSKMTNSDLMKMLLFTAREVTDVAFVYEYNDYRKCEIYNETNDYVYGANGKRGKWSEISL